MSYSRSTKYFVLLVSEEVNMDSALLSAEAFIPFPHIIEAIFESLNIQSKNAMYNSHEGWRKIIIRLALWRRLAFKIAQSSSRKSEILRMGGLDRQFDAESKDEESEHFRRLCLNFDVCTFFFNHAPIFSSLPFIKDVIWKYLNQ